MKKTLFGFLPALLALSLLPSLPAALGGRPAAAAEAGEKAGAQTVTGPVKGSPTGKTFTIGRKGGPVTVDASKAKVRQNGKFASFDLIKGGTMVTAKGTMDGTTLKASEVEVHAKKGAAPAPKK